MRNFAIGLIVLSLLGAASQAQAIPALATMPSDVPVADQARLLRQQVQQLQAQLDSQKGKGLFRIMPKNLMEWAWFIAGMLGEFVFFLRFVVQWLASERAKKQTRSSRNST